MLLSIPIDDRKLFSSDFLFHNSICLLNYILILINFLYKAVQHVISVTPENV